MNEYIQYNDILLDQHEWSSGLGKNDKEVMKAQTARKREIQKGFAKIIKGD